MIITDPPYGINKKGIRDSESLETFYKILPECKRVLKQDSFFITFFSTKRLPELFINNPFDPFIGSGSTALACKMNNRRFVGFEIVGEYCNLANQRLDKFKVP